MIALTCGDEPSAAGLLICHISVDPSSSELTIL
jgi:hypothetical protein